MSLLYLRADAKTRSKFGSVLDIEGSEREAILGMKHVLNRARPKLVICAYHKIEDYYELVNAINDVCSGYSLKLRHFTETVSDSIVYGIYEK
jgi:hypothetical protein